MGIYFKETDEMYLVYDDFYNRLRVDPKVGPRILKQGLVFRFVMEDPDGVVTINGKVPEGEVICGQCDVGATITMSMKSDVGHRFWLGKVNLLAAIATRQMKVKGPITKLMAILPILKPAFKIYPKVLREKGLEKYID